MTVQQNTIQAIVDSERSLILNAPAQYGAYYDHALSCALYFSICVKSINQSRWVCGDFLSQTKKHLLLSVFSTVRLHKVQAKMDLRHAMESGANAAFAIAHPDHKHFVVEKDGLLESPKSLTQRRYKWLDDSYSKGSDAIKGIKDQINETLAHSSLITTHHDIVPSPGASTFHTPFFDDEDPYHVETDLWLVGHAAIVLMDVLWTVNRNVNGIAFAEDFETQYLQLQKQNQHLRSEKVSGERYKRAMEHRKNGK